MRSSIAISLSCLAATIAHAQTIVGTVRETGSSAPIPGVVVLALDSALGTRARVISDFRGQYRIVISPAVRTLRFLRIGFSPEERATTSAYLDVSMRALSLMLAPVEIRENARCPRRADRELTFSLWEQARTALLAAVVSREADPPRAIRIIYKRTRTLEDRVAEQLVQIDSAAVTTRPFVAVLSSEDFVRGGFARDSSGQRKYLAPYADVLLEDAFFSGHCFRARDGGPARRTQLGVVFETVNRGRNRVDVDGTIWVDTAARTLVGVEFRYVGLSNVDPAVRPGGEIWFQQMSNGLLISDRWQIRGSGANERPAHDEFGEFPRVDTRIMATEFGGELVAASWTDGSTWLAKMGGFIVRGIDLAGSPSGGFELRVRGTNYGAVANQRGIAGITNMLPGPYRAVIADSLLGRVGLMASPPIAFTVERDSIVERLVVVRSAIDNFYEYCTDARSTDTRDAVLVVRVRTPDGLPVTAATWEVRRSAGSDWPVVYKGGHLHDDGTLDRCLRFRKGDTLRIVVSRDGQAPLIETRTLDAEATVVGLTVPQRSVRSR